MKLKTTLLLTPLLCGPLLAQSLTVDWLALQTGGTTTSFTLLDDLAAPTATGSVSISSGIAFPGFPIARTLADAPWLTIPDFEDSVLGTQSMSVIEMRVAPFAGVTTYSINLSVPGNTPLVLAIGDLFRNGVSGTTGVGVFAQSDTVSYLPILDGIHGYAGTRVFDQDLAWDPGTQFLSTSPLSNGDSDIAFFRIPAISGTNPRLTLQIPNGLASGGGETITFALGTAIPESSTLLLSLSLAIPLLRRSRKP